MKRKDTISILLICVLYLGAYIVVRSIFRPTGYKGTVFHAPNSEMKCVQAYSLYYAFYPIGKLDSLLTGNDYELLEGENFSH